MYVIVDHANNKIANAETRAAAERFIEGQGMKGGWWVKLTADWKGPR